MRIDGHSRPELPDHIEVVGDRLLVYRELPDKKGDIVIPANASESIRPFIRYYLVAKGDGESCKRFNVGEEVLVDVARATQVYPWLEYHIIDAAAVVGVRRARSEIQ